MPLEIGRWSPQQTWHDPVTEAQWPELADTVEKHIVLVFSGSRIRPEWRDARDHVWNGLSNVGALQRTCGTIYLRTSDAASWGEDFERRSTLEFFNNILRKRTEVLLTRCAKNRPPAS